MPEFHNTQRGGCRVEHQDGPQSEELTLTGQVGSSKRQRSDSADLVHSVHASLHSDLDTFLPKPKDT